MNFFDFSSEDQSWTISKKLWLYCVITVPLTAVTVFIWAFAFRIDAARRQIMLRLKELLAFRSSEA